MKQRLALQRSLYLCSGLVVRWHFVLGILFRLRLHRHFVDRFYLALDYKPQSQTYLYLVG